MNEKYYLKTSEGYVMSKDHPQKIKERFDILNGYLAKPERIFKLFIKTKDNKKHIYKCRFEKLEAAYWDPTKVIVKRIKNNKIIGDSVLGFYESSEGDTYIVDVYWELMEELEKYLYNNNN